MKKFDKLFKEAIEDDDLFSDETKDVVDDYESVEEPLEEPVAEEVTVTLTSEEVSALRSIQAKLDAETTPAEDELGGEDLGLGEDDFSEIEELEREAVETETPPTPESAIKKSWTGKAVDQRGDLEGAEKAKGHDEGRVYKFVKREKPQELKHKTTGHKKTASKE